TALALDRRASRVLVGLEGPPRVEVFEAASMLPADSIPAPARVAPLLPEERGNGLCLVLAPARELRLVRLVGHALAAVVELPGEPGEVAFVGDK
ncbi:MAG TPA: hypothetical protein VJS92_09205, partial [Candidatus Polarisedimenticolaceae bacterium]|nr:hypothetical protein [Candidatus Polarisedimenticolaceae bacterium]